MKEFCNKDGAKTETPTCCPLCHAMSVAIQMFEDKLFTLPLIPRSFVKLMIYGAETTAELLH